MAVKTEEQKFNLEKLEEQRFYILLFSYSKNIFNKT